MIVKKNAPSIELFSHIRERELRLDRREKVIFPLLNTDDLLFIIPMSSARVTALYEGIRHGILSDFA